MSISDNVCADSVSQGFAIADALMQHRRMDDEGDQHERKDAVGPPDAKDTP